ncbi:hypothetical protein ACTFIV_000699 [Dictyostelium citrinum]
MIKNGSTETRTQITGFKRGPLYQKGYALSLELPYLILHLSQLLYITLLRKFFCKNYIGSLEFDTLSLELPYLILPSSFLLNGDCYSLQEIFPAYSLKTANSTANNTANNTTNSTANSTANCTANSTTNKQQ